jgi:hypothetical protein
MWTLQDPGGEVIPVVTSVSEHEGKLYLGNLAHSFVGELDLALVGGARTSTRVDETERTETHLPEATKPQQ